MVCTDPQSESSPKLEHSNISEYSTATLLSSPLSPIHHRDSYFPIDTLPKEEQDLSSRGAHGSPLSGSPGPLLNKKSQPLGLGIDNVETQRQISLAGVPVRSKGSPHTPAADDPLLSPPANPGHHQSPRGMEGPYEDDRLTHSNISVYQSFTADSEQERLNRETLSSPLRRHDPSCRGFDCRSKQTVQHNRCSWLSIIILVLAVYLTVFSGMWLVLAIIRPRYGRRISNGSGLPPSTASLLCAAFAKSVELSFTTVFVAFIGQVLSRRAFVKKSKGITIAEMSMRSWVMQPGTLMTHGETVRYAAFTLLGTIALLAALMGMVYTTASDALVTPKLKFGKLESRILYGKVATQFANPNYIKANCPTLIVNPDDAVKFGDTCVDLEHPGQAFHNFHQYRSDWAKSIDTGNTTGRPNPVGLLHDNTTVTGSWINKVNMADVSARHGRIINNVTMAMPHSGVFAAAREPLNGILQPYDLNGLGEYLIHASVPSPAVNILCAAMTADELGPLVYTSWPQFNGTLPETKTWPAAFDIPVRPSWLNTTSVDDIFGFGKKYNRRHPVFPKLPHAFNTIINSSTGYFDSLYLLAASETDSYMLCSIRQSLTPNCSTTYRVSANGGSLISLCEDPTDELAYRKSQPLATNGVWNSDWINIAIGWANSIGLNSGIRDANAANARFLSRLIPTEPHIDPTLPSIAEALAVLAGSTLLTASLNAPFIHYWNYSVPLLEIPQYQAFNASLRTQDYASGATQHWQGIFYIVLGFVFITNLFCLGYFLFNDGLVTDFIEPQNLFCISLNSPPSQRLEGSCGGGPEEEQLRAKWFIGFEDEKEHFFIGEGDAGDDDDGKGRKIKHLKTEMEMGFWKEKKRQAWERTGERDKGNEEGWKGVGTEGSPLTSVYKRLSRKRFSFF